MKISAKIFLEDAHSYVLGPGRVALLKAIDKLGSLNKAAQDMGMSYRWAWARIRNSEKSLGIPLLTQEGDGARGRSKVLTAEAKELLQWYAEVERQVAASLELVANTRPDFLQLNQKSSSNTKQK